jgi:twinkle protein
VQITGSAQRLQKRNISQKVCEKYKIYRDGDKLRFYYHDESGIVKGAKVKTKDKQFRYEGESTGTFFGQHLFPSTGKRVVITEGELDAVSCYEAMSGWPMVSLPSGAAAAKKSVQRNLQWLQGYEEIVLFFDNDAAGRQATEEACQVLPPGKVKIANLLGDYKDASDALSANDSHAADHDYPFQGLQSKLHGIRYGELVTITAGSGIGKSSFCRELATNLLSKGERVGYLALEESNRRTALTMANWNLYLFDGFGSYDPDVIYNRIEYLASGLDCRIIFLDHLSILLSGLDGDERRMIDTTMTKLRSLVERTGIALFLVSHLKRTSSDQNHEEGARVTLGQLRGSAAIAQLSDACIGLERDQQSGGKQSDTTVRILKNRYSGETGIACQLSYDLPTCKFYETQPEPEFNAATDF